LAKKGFREDFNPLRVKPLSEKSVFRLYKF